MKNVVFSLLVFGMLPSASMSQQQAVLKIHLIGFGEYEAAKSLAEFKKHLEQHYRVDCTASLGVNGKKLDNLDPLRTTELLVLFARRMNLPEEQMVILRNHWEKGKPIVALRTATVAFQQTDNEALGKVLGGDYQGPGSYTTPFKAIADDSQKDHPILRGVGPINSRGPYRFGKLSDKAVVLQIVESDKKIKAPATWIHEYQGSRMFYSTMGVPEDFQNEHFRRLLVILYASKTGSSSKVWKLSVNNVAIWSLYLVCKLLRQPSIAQVKDS